MNYDVFISYSHRDKNVADAIANHLENNGFRCWYAPRDIETGQLWADSIINAINQCKLLVLVFTDFSNESDQVKREVDNALNHGLTIIPFKLTQKPPQGAMEYYLSTLHWLDAMNGPLEKAIEELCQRVSTIITGESAEIKVPIVAQNTLKMGKTAKLLIGIPCALIIGLAFVLIFSGFVLIADTPEDALLCIFMGLAIGTPPTTAVLSFIKNKKPSRKTIIISGIVIVVSIIGMVIFGSGTLLFG